MSNKVILFFPDTGESLAVITPPLAPLALASTLLEASFKVAIIDARVDKDWEQRLKNELKDALLFGTSAITGPQVGSALKASKIVKDYSKGTPVVWGGWHASILSEQTLEHPLVDIVAVGQGESTIVDLAQTAAKGKSWENVKGIFYKQNGKIIQNKNREFESLDNFPLIPWYLINFDDYPGRPVDPKNRYGTIRISQGCPFRCTFCANPLVFKRKTYNMSFDKMINELRVLVEEYGAKEIHFMDDLLLKSRKQTSDLCDAILDSGLKFKWYGNARMGLIARMDDNLLKKMKDSGCEIIHPGVEAPSDYMLKFIQKDEKIANLYKCVENLKRHGIRGLYSFIVGYPEEPEDHIKQTFDAIAKIMAIDSSSIVPVCFYTPYPGNPTFELAKQKGFKAPSSLEEWATSSTRKNSTPWMSEEKVDEVMKKDKYYMPAAFPSNILLKKMRSGSLKYLYSLFHIIARYRVQNDFYDYDIDWKLLRTYWRFWGKNHRKLTFLPSIHFRW